MPDRVFDLDPCRGGAVLEKHLHRIADITLLGVIVIPGEAGVFLDLHLRAECVDTRVSGHRVLVVLGGQPAEQQRYGDHVLDAVIPIRRIVQWSRLVDDSNARLLGLYDHFLDLLRLVDHVLVKLHGTFHRCLRVELRWI